MADAQKVSRNEMVNHIDAFFSETVSKLIDLRKQLHDNGYDKTAAYKLCNKLHNLAVIKGDKLIPLDTPKSINDTNQVVQSESYLKEFYRIFEEEDDDMITITSDLSTQDMDKAEKMADKTGKQLKIVSEIKALRETKKLLFDLLPK